MPFPKHIPFTKMHGCANDYLFVDAIGNPGMAEIDAPTVRAMCGRRTGVGADGVIVLARAGAKWGARVINSDGSDGGMCGNGLRCAARLLHDRHGAPKQMTIAMGGRDIAAIVDDARVSLDMGRAALDVARIGIDPALILLTPRDVLFDHEGLRVGFADIGNPHMAIVLDATPTPRQLSELGPRFERHPAFPSGMNVHLVHIEAPGRITMSTHERGVGPTQACGSGACAVVALLSAEGLVGECVDVQVPGGVLSVRAAKDGLCVLTGPVAYVCEGTFEANPSAP